MSRLLSYVKHTMRRRLTGHFTDRGAGFVEYAGLLILIAAVVGAVFSLDIDTRIMNAVSAAVDRVVNGQP